MFSNSLDIQERVYVSNIKLAKATHHNRSKNASDRVLYRSPIKHIGEY